MVKRILALMFFLLSSLSAAIPLTNGDEFYSLSAFRENGQGVLRYGHFVINNDIVNGTVYRYDADNNLWYQGEDTEPRIFLIDGTWTSIINPDSLTGVLESDGTITINEWYANLRLEEINDISDQSIAFDEDGLSFPILFSDSVQRFSFAVKPFTDIYELTWIPTQWDQYGDTGVPFSSLEEIMNANYPLLWDDDSETGIVISASVSTLHLGDSGLLVIQGTDTVVGTWDVINLPGQSTLTVDFHMNSEYEYFDTWNSFLTMYNGNVWTGELTTADYHIDSDAIEVNEQGLQDFKAAVESHFDHTTQGTTALPSLMLYLLH